MGNKTTKKGFTLVELVIVIAVIAILAAVLIPTFSGIIERAKESARIQQVTSARKEFYSDEKNGFVIITETDDYVYYIDNNYYVFRNQQLTNVTSEIDPSEYSPIESTYSDVHIYKRAEITFDGKGYNGEIELSWQTLIDNDIICVGTYTGIIGTDNNNQPINGTIENAVWRGEHFDEIDRLVIDSNVEYICTFYDFTTNTAPVNLTSVYIPAGVKGIEYCAFYGARNLTTLEIADNSGLESIGESAFGGPNGSNAPQITQFPRIESLKTIGKKAFFDTFIDSFIFTENIESIGEDAFYYLYDIVIESEFVYKLDSSDSNYEYLYFNFATGKKVKVLKTIVDENPQYNPLAEYITNANETDETYYAYITGKHSG